MDFIHNKIKNFLSGINIVWLGLIFGLLYWLLESVREVFLYSNKDFTESLISPDILTFWFRFIVLCIILMFSFYAETRRTNITAAKKKNIFFRMKSPGIIIIGVCLSVFFWGVQAVNDAVFFHKGSVIEQIFFPEYKDFWSRFFSVMIIILFSIFIQSHINRNKQLQQILKKVNVKLKKDKKFKNDYLSYIAHEVKNPLAVIKEGILLCFDGKVGDLNDTQKKLLKSCLSNADRLNRLVSDIVEISRIERNKIILHKKEFDISKLCLEVLEQFELNYADKDIGFELFISHSEINVYADPDKITQVLVNLIKNSVDYLGDSGEIKVKLKKTEDEIRCYIMDNGIGIPKNELKSIFSKFQRSNQSEVNSISGFGLGLPIVKGLVDAHEGKIWVKSEEGKGTTFCFTIPLQKKQKEMKSLTKENLLENGV